MSTCRNGAWFAKRCSKPARWIVRVNSDPDTDIELCTVHAELARTRCWPTPVEATLIGSTDAWLVGFVPQAVQDAVRDVIYEEDHPTKEDS